MQTDSRGTATVTNTSGSYHDSGELTCVTTCPGPEPDGCSTTNRWAQPQSLSPGGWATCNMFATTDPCCQDDGDYFLGARFTADQYRTSPTGEWLALPALQFVVQTDLEQDAHASSHQPDKNKATDHGHIQLTADCTPPPSGPDEAITELRNGSKQHAYLVRMRGQAVCPTRDSDPNDLPAYQPICGSETACHGFCDDAAPFPHGCEGLTGSPPDPNLTTNCAPYPPTYDAGSDDLRPGQASDPDFVGQSWDCEPEDPNDPSSWVWCTAALLPDEVMKPQLDQPLNSCCDCYAVRNIIVCAEVDTLAVRKPGQSSFQQINNSHYDKTGRCEMGTIPESKRTSYTCFTTSSSVICDL